MPNGAVATFTIEFTGILPGQPLATIDVRKYNILEDDTSR